MQRLPYIDCRTASEGIMSLPRIVIVCQARMGSSRLPGKVMLPVAGATLLERFIERLEHSKRHDAIVIATTMRAEDGAIVKLCEQRGWNWYRGHSTDLLDRTFNAARSHDADVVVKVPSDCPLIDPDIIDTVIERFVERYPEVDYVSNLHPATWPDGNDVEVMSIDVLERAYRTAKAPHEREHTTPWMWDANADVKCGNVINSFACDYSMSHRWTIDYREDYEFIRSVYEALYDSNPTFTINDILRFLEQHPDIASINSHLCGVNWYRHHLDVLKTVQPTDTRHWSVSSSTEAA